jgi:hypothetical protein
MLALFRALLLSLWVVRVSWSEFVGWLLVIGLVQINGRGLMSSWLGSHGWPPDKVVAQTNLRRNS